MLMDRFEMHEFLIGVITCIERDRYLPVAHRVQEPLKILPSPLQPNGASVIGHLGGRSCHEHVDRTPLIDE
jgi:hypothetical protein